MSFEQIVRVPLERVGVIIGKGGSTRKSFEEELGVVLSVDSKSGSVVVKCESIEKGDTMEAVKMLASGSPHRTVYNMLQKARTKRKMERILLWEEASPEKMAEKLNELRG